MRWFVLPLFLFFSACRDTPPGPDGSEVSLSLEDVSCTEVWLRLKVPASAVAQRVDLLRDGVVLRQLSIWSSDTLLLDEGLLPRHSYTYRAERRLLSVSEGVSEVVLATTLDTTSHDFRWEARGLGDGSGSVLYDVVIINDTLAYAVGEIHVRDSTGEYINPPFNVATWDGRNWRLSTAMDVGYLYGTIYSIFAYDANNLWAGSSAPEHWDGELWTFYGSRRGYPGGFWIRKIWGGTGNNLYFVGDQGNIRRYNNATWQIVESGTTVNINDVWGGLNPSATDKSVLLAASNTYTTGEKKLLRLREDGSIESLFWPMQDRRLHSVWYDKRWPIYVCGGGIFTSTTGDSWHEVTEVPLIFTECIRGSSNNDVIAVGDFGLTAHFNGSTWTTTFLPNGILWSVAIRGNLVIAVGSTGSLALVAIGRR